MQVSTRMYRLGQLWFPVGVSGLARGGGPDDADLAKEWFGDFSGRGTPRTYPSIPYVADHSAQSDGSLDM